MTSGFVKVFPCLLTSSLWQMETLETKVVWVTLMTLTNRDGLVEVSLPGLAKLAGVSIEKCAEAITRLQQPDPYSRNPGSDGRRIEKAPRGWRLLNHSMYREKYGTEERREYLARKQREYRQRRRDVLKGFSAREIINERVKATEREDREERKRANHDNHEEHKNPTFPPQPDP
jgi:hypothetical protein